MKRINYSVGMDQDIFKAPRAKKRPTPNPKVPGDIWAGRKRRRTKEDFIQFCTIVLDYTNYESMRNEDSRVQQNTSPMASGGSPVDSYNSDSSNVSPTETRQASPAQPPFMSPPPPSAGAHNMIRSQKKFSPNSASSSPRSATDIESDEDSFELITCFCMKPFAGRPMIECNECLTWIHLSCAKIRKTNIPDEFTCQKCKDAKLTTRKSTRQRIEKQNLDA